MRPKQILFVTQSPKESWCTIIKAHSPLGFEKVCSRDRAEGVCWEGLVLFYEELMNAHFECRLGLEEVLQWDG